MAARLTATFAAKTTKPGRYGDGRGGHGLILDVQAKAGGGVRKAWIQRIRVRGKATHIGLGPLWAVTLAEARAKALENHRIAWAGGDPRGESAAPTFAEAAERVIAIHAESWANGKNLYKWRRQLHHHAAALADVRVDQITTADVLAVLLPLWHDKPDTARGVRQRIGAVMKWVVAEGWRADNPAGDAIEAALPKQSAKAVHHRALHHSEVADSIDKLSGSGAWPGTVLAYRWCAATACRIGEARHAEWGDIDKAAGVWVVPAAKTKTGREYRVPLSTMAKAVLADAEAIKDGSGLLFPSARGCVMSDGTLTKLLRERGIEATTHGLRSSFRDWAAENGVPGQIAEMCLAHVNTDKTEAAYLRTDMLEARRSALEAWGDYVGGAPG